MRKNSWLMAGATALLLSGPALAQDFGEWDGNDDNALAEDEFTAGVEEAGIFDDWDADDSGVIEEEEFHAGLYDSWDENDSGLVEEDEWTEEEDDWF